MSTQQTGYNRDELTRLRLPHGTLRVLQITDTHLYAEPQGRLLGVDTAESFHSVIDAVHRCDWCPDLILATGDLVHDATPKGYRQLAQVLDGFHVPVHCLPGNHDVPQVMREHLFGQRVDTPQVVDNGDWRIVMLDSVVVGEVGGHLADSELAMLEQALSTTRRHVLVTLHHQPIPVGSRWIDDMGLDNGERLLRLIDAHPQVRGVLWGHVHQSFDRVENGIRWMASPSTCVQFAPHSDGFALDEEAPGFRLLALTPDGSIHSEVIRTLDMPSGLDMASGGYE
jgi:3',5'-cyclic-AMP phosphodiesterase